jgi:hypothetical protein
MSITDIQEWKKLRKTIDELDRNPRLRWIRSGYLRGLVMKAGDDTRFDFGLPIGSSVLVMTNLYPNRNIGTFFAEHGIGTSSRIRLLQLARKSGVDCFVEKPGSGGIEFLKRFHTELGRREDWRNFLGIESATFDKKTGEYRIKFKSHRS